MSRGQSAQRPPHFSAWTIPLSTRRSSTRLLPRAFAGSSGSIRAHCASENQKKSAIDAASSLKAVNHKSGTMGILLLGPAPSLFPALANHVLGVDHASRRCRKVPWFRRASPILLLRSEKRRVGKEGV